MALISTIGAVDSNSYLSVAEADAYFENSLNAVAWTVDDEKKGQALVSATRLIDAKYKFKGVKTDQLQALAFPRYGVYNLDGWSYDDNEIPRRLKNAIAELALSLLTTTDPTFADPATAGIKKVSAGAVSVEFDKDDRSTTIPDAISDLIGHLVASDFDSGFRQVDLRRI